MTQPADPAAPDAAPAAPSAAHGQAAASRSAALFVLLTVALDAAGMGLIMPVLPELLKEFAADGSLGAAAEIGGWIAFSYAAAQFLFAPAVGALSDAFGRRPVLLISMSAMAVEYVLMATTGLLWVLFAARIASGVAGATVSAARAWLADVSAPEDRGRMFGYLGAAFGVGFVLGPAIGGLLGELGPRAPFWAAAGVAGLNAVFGFFALRESLAPALRRPFTLAGADPFRTLRRAVALPGLAPLLIAVLLYDIGVHVYPAAWSFISAAAWGWSTAEIGLSLAIYGASAGASMALLIGPAQRLLGRRRAVVLAMLLEIGLTLSLIAITSGWAIYFLIPLLGLTAIVSPSIQGMISARAPAERQGEISGVLAALMGVAAIVSPPMMTGIFAAFTDAQGAFWPTAPFAAAAAVVLAALVVFLWGARGEAE